MAKRTYLSAEHFNSLEEYLYVTTNRKMNSAFRLADRCASERGSESFTETSSWQEAQDILAKGYEEGLNMILEDKGGINDCATRSRIIRKVDFVGQRPHIVNTIMGRPKTMVHRIKRDVPVKTISILYNNYPVWHVNTSRMIRAGKNFLALVKFLERNDYRVEIRLATPVVVASRKPDFDFEGILPIIRLKEYKQPLNPLMLAYPIVHPSMIRRHLFRYIETSSLTNTKVWTKGYGSPEVDNFGVEYFRDSLVRNNLIDNKQTYFIDWSECEDANEIDDMLTSMKFNK